TVLFVEDDKAIKSTFSKELSNKVSELIISDNADDGYSKYDEFKPDIILIDITMPKVSSLELAKKIRTIDD
ncbi:MAG: response regulator, partial [Campylobacterota bacterium]|nr:response regulator [Campylobacterota bacterium]